MTRFRLYDFAFSAERSHRWQRHAIFWIAVLIYQVVRIAIFFPADKIWVNAGQIILMSLIWGFVLNMCCTYTFAYVLVPRFYYKRRFWLFGAYCCLLIVGLEGLAIIYNIWFPVRAVGAAIGTSFESVALGHLTRLRPGMIRALGNPPLICGFFVALRTMKGWYLEQMQNLQLARERARAELQLLKAQVHPHFLFNTLNNIYAYALEGSGETYALVEKLTDMLNYMVNECNGEIVPVGKELKMLEDYIGLERIRYGERLDLWMDFKGDWRDKKIAPMLMIPFVENSFKHGSSIGRGKQWIQLDVEVSQDKLYFKLVNSKPPDTLHRGHKKGIGLQNVRRRMAMLYPGNHKLEVQSTDSTYGVELEIGLITDDG